MGKKQKKQETPQKKNLAPWYCALLILILGSCIYTNSFDAPFVFDGRKEIENNTAVRRVWPPWGWLTYNVRPLAYFTFALDYELYGFGDQDSGPRGFHATNLMIHLAAALLLFGIVRRTLLQGRGAQRYAEHATYLAAGVALIWMAHPLQTQSVTYIVQRIEALMGMFVLLSLYCFVVARDSHTPVRWLVLSVIACMLGLITKEVAAVTPLLVVAYDRSFVASSWNELFKRRWYYLALFGTWGVFGILMAVQWSTYHGRVGTVEGLTPMQYALTQPGVLAHYLRLTILPVGQCLDYWWPVAKTPGEIVPGLILILGLLALTFWAMCRHPQWGFWGWWFFIILAPTSTIIPIHDRAFEHRMYLSLAGLAALFVIGGYEISQRTGFLGKRGWLYGVVPVVVVILGGLTLLRNHDYRTRVSIWSDVVEQAPHNPRAYLNLGQALQDDQQYSESIRVFLQGIEVDPQYEQLAEVYNSLGVTYLSLDFVNDAAAAFKKSLEADPNYAFAYNNLGSLLANGGRVKQALPYFQRAVELSPGNAEFHTGLGMALKYTGRPEEAQKHFRRALEIDPDYQLARKNLRKPSS